jgi:hypothetical protein
LHIQEADIEHRTLYLNKRAKAALQDIWQYRRTLIDLFGKIKPASVPIPEFRPCDRSSCHTDSSCRVGGCAETTAELLRPRRTAVDGPRNNLGGCHDNRARGHRSGEMSNTRLGISESNADQVAAEFVACNSDTVLPGIGGCSGKRWRDSLNFAEPSRSRFQNHPEPERSDSRHYYREPVGISGRGLLPGTPGKRARTT